LRNGNFLPRTPQVVTTRWENNHKEIEKFSKIVGRGSFTLGE